MHTGEYIDPGTQVGEGFVTSGRTSAAQIANKYPMIVFGVVLLFIPPPYCRLLLKEVATLLHLDKNHHHIRHNVGDNVVTCAGDGRTGDGVR